MKKGNFGINNHIHIYNFSSFEIIQYQNHGKN